MVVSYGCSWTLLVVVEEDEMVIVITTFRIHDEKKYERHKINKIRRKEWTPYE